MRKYLSRRKHPKLVALSIGLLSILVIYAVYAFFAQAWPFDRPESPTTENAGSFINYGPPTETELREGQDAKKNNEKRDEAIAAQPEGKVSVQVSFARFDPAQNAVDIRAYTSNVIEGGGTCTATLTKDDKTVTATTQGFIDATSTICEPIHVPRDRFSAGTWDLVVTYASTKNTGTSETLKVDIR